MERTPACRLARYPQQVPSNLRGGIVTIGNFDGVHLGHQHVLEVLRSEAAGTGCCVISFYPHPLRVLGRSHDLRYLSSVREKRDRLAALGVDLLYLMHFTPQIAAMSASTFIEQVLFRALNARVLVVGEDAAIGRGREGNLKFLQEHLPQYGIALRVVPKFESNGVRPSSRAIRGLLAQGDVSGAAVLLGRPFAISARVGHGDKRGSSIGFPTANIAAGSRLIPARGVYACRVALDGLQHNAVANIGTRPTFNGHGERLEVHILDYNPGRLYGRRVEVSFLGRLRDERRFESVDRLKQQIACDIAQARELLALNYAR
jgi:riboflavin kinase/FMN adenylyltransferase